MSEPLNTGFDNDMDAFLNFDQSEPTQISTSMSDSKPLSALLQDHNDFGSNASTFSGPSYQYDSHRQQTGPPMGAYHSTLAINNANGLHYRPGNHFVMPTQTLNMPLTDLGDFDFSKPMDNADMDFENEGPTDMSSMFFNGEASSAISPVAPIPPRIYPGMHSQQANQAKMAAQKYQETTDKIRQMPAGQKPLPTTTPTLQTTGSMSKDPHVEESISRLLSRMRQSSNVSAGDDDEDDESPTGPRIKKDEDDMDEDERLLNSEEGKKLSSKERRQLRNKVSARAFRSRRKEYITQLEAEVAGKAQEANELRIQNRQLMEENTRLTDLTRMLLSSNAFSGFLQELSSSGIPNSAIQQQARQARQSPQTRAQPQQQVQQQPQPQPTQKDISSHEAARQLQTNSQHMQVGMTLIPETPIDMSVFDGHHSWNNSLASNDFSVFAVTELPEPPKLDMSAMTEKPFEPKSMKSVSKDVPIIPAQPILSECEPSGDLFEQESSHTVSLEVPTTLMSTLSKVAVRSEFLAITKSAQGTAADLQQLCSEMNEQCDRLSQLF